MYTVPASIECHIIPNDETSVQYLESDKVLACDNSEDSYIFINITNEPIITEEYGFYDIHENAYDYKNYDDYSKDEHYNKYNSESCACNFNNTPYTREIISVMELTDDINNPNICYWNDIYQKIQYFDGICETTQTKNTNILKIFECRNVNVKRLINFLIV